MLFAAIPNCLVSAQESSEEKVFSKGIFSLSYPTEGWQLEELKPPPGKKNTNIKLTATGTPKLMIVVTWEDGVNAEDPTRSVVAAQAFGLPIALNLADQKSENIISSIGLINLSEVSDLGARFTIVKPGTSKTTNIDAFVARPENAPGNMIMGAIISEGSQKEKDLNDEYYDRLYAAYGIVQSIALKPTE